MGIEDDGLADEDDKEDGPAHEAFEGELHGHYDAEDGAQDDEDPAALEEHAGELAFHVSKTLHVIAGAKQDGGALVCAAQPHADEGILPVAVLDVVPILHEAAGLLAGLTVGLEAVHEIVVGFYHLAPDGIIENAQYRQQDHDGNDQPAGQAEQFIDRVFPQQHGHTQNDEDDGNAPRTRHQAGRHAKTYPQHHKPLRPFEPDERPHQQNIKHQKSGIAAEVRKCSGNPHPVANYRDGLPLPGVLIEKMFLRQGILHKGQYNFDGGHDDIPFDVPRHIEFMAVGEIEEHAEPEPAVDDEPEQSMVNGELQRVNNVEDQVEKINIEQRVNREWRTCFSPGQPDHGEWDDHLHAQDHIGNRAAFHHPFAQGAAKTGDQEKPEQVFFYPFPGIGPWRVGRSGHCLPAIFHCGQVAVIYEGCLFQV